MPKKNFITVQLAPKRYDRCQDCPFCGLIPENERPEGFKYVCIGTHYTLTQADFDGKSKKRDCDNRWELWMQLPKRRYKLNEQLYKKYRVPFETAQK